MTPRQEVESTIWQILRAHTCGVIARDVDPTDTATVSMVLEPHFPRLQQTTAMLMLCVDQAVAAHLSDLQSALHSQTGMDDDLIDEAVSAAACWSGEPSEPIDL